jgi:hypothetical protein
MSRTMKSALNRWDFCKPAAEQAVGISDVTTAAADANAAVATTTTRLLIHSEFCYYTDKVMNHIKAHVRNSVHRDLLVKSAVLGQRL